MGCDIHLHIEVKISGVWHHWASPYVKRDYQLFAKMAGVRNCGITDPISKPKGMPDNPTFTTEFECKRWGADGHSHSWFGFTEIKELAVFVKNDLRSGQWLSLEHHILNGSWLCGNPFAGLKEYPNDYPKEIEDVRFIFWFDNYPRRA